MPNGNGRQVQQWLGPRPVDDGLAPLAMSLDAAEDAGGRTKARAHDAVMEEAARRESLETWLAKWGWLWWYDFEQIDWQGWTRVDNTAPGDTCFHVDDFAGLGGGTYGRLVPLEGAKSLWCGARPGATAGWYTCNWGSAR